MSEQKMIRPEEHETDTAARRIVPGVMPNSWEHREPGGRDYGVDMQVEIFADGKATGGVLLLQIKGTTDTIDETEGSIAFKLNVSTLRYSELFSVPFLLVLCPVRQEPRRCYFLWLQEYIEAVLNFENTTWRSNDYRVTVKIPSGNKLPDLHQDLADISNEPLRIKSWSRLAHLVHEARSSLSILRPNFSTDQEAVGRIQNALNFVDQMKVLQCLDQKTFTGSLVQTKTINPLRSSLVLLASGRPIHFDEYCNCFPLSCELDILRLKATGEYGLCEGDTSDMALLLRKLTIRKMDELFDDLMASFSIQFNASMRNKLWNEHGWHRF